MISLTYVNNQRSSRPIINECKSFNLEVADLVDEIDHMFSSYYNKYHMLVIESEIMGDDSELKAFLEESEENNVFAKIGNKVKQFFEKIIAFVNNIMDKLKNKSFSTKNDLAKVEALVKKHPEFKDKIVEEFQKGNLRVSDLKSYAELENTFNQLMELSRKADQDPASIGAKWDAAVSKFKKGATVTVAVAGGLATLYTLINKINDHNKKMQENLSAIREKSASLLADDKENEKAFDDSKGMHQLKWRMFQSMTNNTKDMIAHNYGLIGNIGDKIAGLIDSISNATNKGNALKRASNEFEGLKKSAEKIKTNREREESLKDNERYHSVTQRAKDKKYRADNNLPVN